LPNVHLSDTKLTIEGRANFLLCNHRPHVVDRAFFLFELDSAASKFCFRNHFARSQIARGPKSWRANSKSASAVRIALLPMRHRA